MDKLEVTINQKQDQRGAVMEVIQTKLAMIQKESQAARQASASSKGPATATASA
jgi:dTDP-4-dehydrorhamnose 3,5-epimerase-like enzyme